MEKNKNIKLYLHIPFCVKKCAYCDFLSFPCMKKEDISSYADALAKRIREKAKDFKDRTLDSVFIGGGTPSLLDEADFLKISDAVFESFNPSGNLEFTLEANPGTVNKSKLLSYIKGFVNRLSFGLQSTIKTELETIGRIHTYEDFLKSYELAREVGVDNINIDLMQALPYQTRESHEESLRRVLSLKPEHISAYSLILEENTPLFDIDKSLLPNEDTERLMYHDALDILSEYGYERYEISNYAKPGFYCIHNIGYWECDDYLGLGLGASSLVDNVRFKETSNFSEFLSAPCERGFVDITKLSLEDRVEEFMFLGLRMTEGISLVKFKERFNLDFLNVYEDVCKKHTENGLLEFYNDNKNIRLTKKGLDLADYVMTDFMEPDIS